MITDKLIHKLQSRFPDVGAKFGAPPAPAVVIPAVHPDVGDIQIFDDGSEITLIAGNFTHGHFSDFDSKSHAQAEQNIVDDVIAFLERLFADQIVLWGTNHGGGGWFDRARQQQTDPLLDELKQRASFYVWSGPLAR